MGELSVKDIDVDRFLNGADTPKKITVTPLTRKDYEAQATASCRKWINIFHLDSWELTFKFGNAIADASLQNEGVAYNRYKSVTRTLMIVFDERLRPEWYEYVACHEVLHTLFAPIHDGIDMLTEPAKTLMDRAIHWPVELLARVLTNLPSPYENGGTDLLPEPPWSH